MKTPRLSTGFLEKVVDSVQNFHYWMSRQLRRTPQDYFEIETTQADTVSDGEEKESYAIVAKDGSVLTVLEFDGVRTIMDRNSIKNKILALERSGIASLLKNAGFTFEFFFSMSPDGGEEMIRKLTQKNRETVRKFALNFDDVMDSKIAYLPKFIHFEKCYLGIWTHPSSIDKFEYDIAVEDKMKELRESRLPPYKIQHRNAQYPYGGLDVLANNHRGMIIDVVDELNKQLGFKLKKLTAHEALNVVKTVLYGGEEVSEDWKPIIFGDPIPVSVREQKVDKKSQSLLLDSSDLVYPPLSMQILDSDIYTPKEDPKIVVIGNRIFSTVNIEIPPTKPTQFNDLLVKLVDAKIPFNMRYVIKSDGLSYKGLKGTIATALNFLPPNNKRISEALKYMSIISERETMVRYSIAFSTYAKLGEERLLRSRISRLKYILASWGQGQPKDAFGDAVDAFFDTVPFISPNTGYETNYHIAPLYDVFKMAPIFRPASVFEGGACLYRSEDGKLVPFEVCSPRQTTWAYYIMALPGSGKSVDLAIKILGAITQAGIERLPYIASLDIGKSQSYLIQMIQSAYPQYLKHLAISERLTMHKRHAINMFDLHLGCEKPDEIHREMLINFMCELLTPPSAEKIDDNFPPLIAATIDRAYQKISLLNRDGMPKVYSPNTDVLVDEAVRKHRIPYTANLTSWYQIRNDLFDVGEILAAERAQRYAVPTIGDLVEAVKDQDIIDTYGKLVSIDGSGEKLLAKFSRLIGIAANNFPNLFVPTAIDFSSARIVSLDLDLVTKGEGDTGRKQQVIMYMVAKYAITKNFRLDNEIVASFPERYQRYHYERVQEMYLTNKILCVDEYHRTKNSQFIQNDFIRDAREGRKWKLSMILSSQQGDDISDELRKFLTGVFILKATSEEHAKDLQTRFGFGDAEKQALLEKCNGPTEKGAPFLAILQTDEGVTTQLLYSTISPVEVWALTTTVEDVQIRNKLAEKLGDVEARGRLARAYNFSIKHRVQELRDANLKGPNDDKFDPIERIYENLMKSSPVYTHQEGAIFDAKLEVQHYVDEQNEIKTAERLKRYEEEKARLAEKQQLELNEKDFESFKSQENNKD